MNRGADLTIRQFERSDVVLDGEFEVAPAHADQVAFSPAMAAAKGPRAIRITVSDIGAGGIGFCSPVGLPRMLCGEIRIFAPGAHGGAAGDPQAPRCVAFQHAVRLRRCELTSRVPSFFIGSSFENADERLESALSEMLECIASSMRRVMAARDAAEREEAPRA